MAPTAHEPSLARAADELAELLSEGALQDVLILQRLPGLRTVLESAGLRLMSFCQCFPERFSLRFVPEWGLRVSLAPASSEPALDLPLVENMLEAAIVQHVERYHDSTRRTVRRPPRQWRGSSGAAAPSSTRTSRTPLGAICTSSSIRRQAASPTCGWPCAAASPRTCATLCTRAARCSAG